jgi:hypothetical protein
LAGFSSLLAGQFGYAGGGMNIISGIININQSQNPNMVNVIEPWLANIIFDVIFSVILLVLSAIRINPVRKKIFSNLRFRKR